MIEELKRREEDEIKKQLAEPKVVMCGSYERGANIRAKISISYGMNHFYFRTKVLEKEHYKLMKSVLGIKYRSGALMYQARPYTTDIGQVKLYHQFGEVQRCQIKDLFTVNVSGEIKLLADILLIDRGWTMYKVQFKHLYDPPQYINYYKDIEPEAKLSRLNLGPPIPSDFNDKEVNDCFRNSIRKNSHEEFTVRIFDYKEGMYYVDVINKQNQSLIAHLKEKFRDKIERIITRELIGRSDKDSTSDDEYILEILPQARPKRGQRFKSNEPLKSSQFICRTVTESSSNKRIYRDVLAYFKDKIDHNEKKGPNMSYLQKRFFKVKILSWCDPASFVVVPDDPDYIRCHDDFRREIESYQNVNEEEDGAEEEEFLAGQLCLFKNDIDLNLGKWLRGIVIRVPEIENAFVKDKTNAKGSAKGPCQSEGTDDQCRCIDRSYFVYQILSVDYGFKCYRSSYNMRQIKDERIFSRGPWSLRCRLFGVHPNLEQREFSKSCIEMIDSWVRSRILDTGKFAFFHVLFRTDLSEIPKVWRSDGPMAEISLFHRFEPPYKIEDCILPRKRRSRFDCLNAFLINRGFASDYSETLAKSSKVELDEFVVNLLVPHDRI